MPFDTVVLKTIEYLSLPSVVGHEQFFMDFLENDFQQLGLNTKTYDGILEVSGKTPHSQIISAHIDRHGLISIGNDQYKYAAQHIKETKYGEENKSSQKLLQSINDRFEGEHVLAYHPYDGTVFGTGHIRSSQECLDNGDAIFTIEGLNDVPEDTPIAYARSATTEGRYLKGQIDNVVSLGIIYTLFQNGFQGTALLTCEEEIGKSWVHITNWLTANDIKTKNLLILDTSPYNEEEPIEKSMVILRNRDKSASFNHEYVRLIRERCEDLGLNYQIKDEYLTNKGVEVSGLGSTELGRIVENTDGLWSGATIQIPTLEYHTSYETTSRDCIERYYAILQSILVKNPFF